MTMLRMLTLVSCLVSEAFAFSMYHRFENTAIFSIPFNASEMRQDIHPALKVDHDKNGVAWFSILSSQLVSVPILKPTQVQLLTYVTGPDPVTKQPVKGSWVTNVFYDSIIALGVAKRLVPPGTDVTLGEGMAILEKAGTYLGVRGSKLHMNPYWRWGRDPTAKLDASCSVKDQHVEFDSDFFLNRSAWFHQVPCQSEKSCLAVSMLRGNKFNTPPRKLTVSHLFSDLFAWGAVGPSMWGNMTEDVCKQHKESCFFAGEQEVTIESPVVIPDSASPTSSTSGPKSDTLAV